MKIIRLELLYIGHTPFSSGKITMSFRHTSISDHEKVRIKKFSMYIMDFEPGTLSHKAEPLTTILC